LLHLVRTFPRWLARGAALASLVGSLALASLSGCQANSNSGYVSDSQALAQLKSEPIDAKPWNFGQNQGVLITTENYRIYTTVRDPLYQRLLGKVLEGAHARAVAVNPSGRVKSALDCYVFGSRAQWETYTNLRAGSNAPTYLQISAGGYCQEGVFAGYDIGREQTLSVIAHEAWHQYSWYAFKDRLPSWIEEGLATQNEAIDWDGVTPHFQPANNYRRWLALKQAVRDGRLWKINDLASTHAGQVIKMNQKSVDAYYAELWSLTLFLQNSPKYNKGLERMLADANAGTLAKSLDGAGLSRREVDGFSEHWNTVAGPVYLKKYISPDLATLQNEYESWAREFVNVWPPKPTVGIAK
jgi:hypothetical protein